MSVTSTSRDHRAARNQASITFADAGAGASSIALFDAPGGNLLAVRTLAKPCGTITVEGRIQLLPAVDNDLVLITGMPAWGVWRNGNGVSIFEGAVTDEAGDGTFKLAGTETMMIYAGGVVVLSSPALLG